MPAQADRPRLLVLNQYYWPGVEATAHLLTDLCEALADEYDIRVLTGMLHGHELLPHRSVRNGVEIVRVHSTAFERSRLGLRGLNYVSYLGNSLVRALSGPKPDLVLCMTDPPMIGDVGLAVSKRFGVPLLVISEDVFPEIATKLRRLESPVLVGVLRQLVRLYLKRADRVVAIGETMRQRLEAKGAPGERLRVIPNWIDTTTITPQEHENEWKRMRKLAGKFVVMHSGNVGHAQDLDTLVRATTFLRDLDDLAVVIVGFGARHAEIQALAARLETDKVRFLPYQPREVLPLSLAAGNLHFVGLARGLSGYVVPSRLYGVLAAARPVIVSADPDSETAQVVGAVGCGVVLPPGRPELVARVIRDAHDGKLDLEEMGRRGREYVTAEADRAVAVDRYRSVLAELRP
ncbi:MAG TPA: glycosyltransferase family 4 protein [Gaiellaceae bacterium]|nr:glycosyltransferase family 4 protein [Gaiellaceae bacterium]